MPETVQVCYNTDPLRFTQGATTKPICIWKNKERSFRSEFSENLKACRSRSERSGRREGAGQARPGGEGRVRRINSACPLRAGTGCRRLACRNAHRNSNNALQQNKTFTLIEPRAGASRRRTRGAAATRPARRGGAWRDGAAGRRGAALAVCRGTVASAGASATAWRQASCASEQTKHYFIDSITKLYIGSLQI
ncbi:unnamed protein product [Spodoptera exigua]|nr:unnamed protein product [Spodoptera exigua]